MGVDYTLAWDCGARNHFGEGNSVQGAVAVLSMLKSRDRSRVASEIMRQEGKDPAEEAITVVNLGPGGAPVEQEVRVADMEAHAKPLEEWESSCASCCASLSGEAFGCHGRVSYPVPRAAEEWLISRFQPFDTVGNELCRIYMGQMGITGDHVRGLRKRGLTEAATAPSISRRVGLLRRETISTDQLLQVLWYANNGVNPLLCEGFLAWFGAMAVDGVVPRDMADAERLRQAKNMATCEERKARTSFVLEMPSVDAPHFELAQFLRTMYLAWVNNVFLLVDA